MDSHKIFFLSLVFSITVSAQAMDNSRATIVGISVRRSQLNAARVALAGTAITAIGIATTLGSEAGSTLNKAAVATTFAGLSIATAGFSYLIDGGAPASVLFGLGAVIAGNEAWHSFNRVGPAT